MAPVGAAANDWAVVNGARLGFAGALSRGGVSQILWVTMSLSSVVVVVEMVEVNDLLPDGEADGELLAGLFGFDLGFLFFFEFFFEGDVDTTVFCCCFDCVFEQALTE